MNTQLIINSFGYKSSWLAIKQTSPEEIIQKIQPVDIKEASWEEAMRSIYDYDTQRNNKLILTPNIRGWVFVVGSYVGDFKHPEGKLEWLKERMVELSTEFGETQAFATNRVSEYHHWILAKNGIIKRCFAYAGDGGDVLYNEGETTSAEQGLPWDRLVNYGLPTPWFPNEEDVMTIAEKWSVNPLTIEEKEIQGKKNYITTLP